MMPTLIHPTALVDSGASLADGVSIGPFCIVGKDAKLGKNTKLISNVVIDGDSSIGENCVIYPFTTIGMAPQDIKYKNEPTKVVIGDNAILRENVTIHRASSGGDGATIIGSDFFLMAYGHIAHDCIIGDHVIMANAASIGGHVRIDDRVFIGGVVAVHQFVRIGAYAMIGGLSGVIQDVPPYMMASGQRARLFGLNSIGLKRNGFSEEQIGVLKQAYKILFREKHTISEGIKKVQEALPYTEEIAQLIDFIKENKRGICQHGDAS